MGTAPQTPQSSRRSTLTQDRDTGSSGPHQSRDITPEEALGQLVKFFRRKPDQSFSVKGSHVIEYVNRDAPDADTLVIVRMSTADGKDGKTLVSHLKAILGNLERFERRWRKVVVTTQNSGARPFDDRPDIDAIIRELHDGWVEAVAYRNVDRIARDVIVGELVCRLLQRTQTALYVSEFDQAVNWDNDALSWRIRNIVAEEERRSLALRTGYAFEDQWLLAHKGYSGLERKLGFMRLPKPDNFIVVNPELWKLACSMFELVVRYGLKEATAELRKRVCITEKQVSKLIRDPVYMHGEMVVEWCGKEYSVRPVELPEPVARPLWQAANDVLDTRRGAHTRTLPGQYALNGIHVFHAGCEGALYDGPIAKLQGHPIVLTGREHRGMSAGYRHYPTLPNGQADRTCVNFRAPQELLEPKVCALLRKMAAELPSGYRFSPQQRKILDARIQELEMERTRLEDEFFDSGQRARCRRRALDVTAYTEYLGALNRQLRRLKRRRATWDALSELPSTSGIPHPRDLLLFAFDAIVTDLPPADARAMQRRQLVIEACVGHVSCGYDAQDELRVRVFGRSLSDDPDCPVPVYPLQAARPHLEAFLLEYALERKNAHRGRRGAKPAKAAGGLGATRSDQPWHTPPRAKAPTELPAGHPAWEADDRELETR